MLKKMAETRRSTALAFDGIYGNSAQLGLPLPLVAILSMKNLTLESAMWNARCSASGFSVTLSFKLTEESGPALRYTTKKGVALTPIRMPSLSDDSEDCPDATRKYLESCKSVEYVRVDGKPGLTVHQGHCHFWTAIELTPEVVGTRPD